MELSSFEQKYQEQFTEEQKEKINELRNFIKKIIDDLGLYKTYEKIILPLSKKLINKYPETKSCYLFHVLIGSSAELKNCSCFDLEEEKSIIKQLKNKYYEQVVQQRNNQ